MLTFIVAADRCLAYNFLYFGGVRVALGWYQGGIKGGAVVNLRKISVNKFNKLPNFAILTWAKNHG